MITGPWGGGGGGGGRLQYEKEGMLGHKSRILVSIRL